MRNLLGLLCAFLIAVPASAQPVTPRTITPVSIHGSVVTNVVGTCTLGTQPNYTNPLGITDGCAGAPNSPSFAAVGRTAFFGTSWARQSGQVSYPSLPSWNIAGVDFGVGRDTSQTLLDPTVGGNVPTGCTYYATGWPGHTTWPTYLCGPTTNGQTINVKNLDFCGTSSSGAAANGIYLIVGPDGNNTHTGSTQTITVQNNKFCGGSTSTTETNNVNMIFAGACGSCAAPPTLNILDNDFNGNFAPSDTFNKDVIDINWISTVVAEYNVFYDIAERPYDNSYATISPSTFTWRYNYAGQTTVGGYGMCNNCGGSNFHGEMWQQDTDHPPQQWGNVYSDFNTILVGANGLNQSWTAAFFFADDEGDGATIAIATEDNNTVINNICMLGGMVCTGANGFNIVETAFLHTRLSSFGSFDASQNYVDPAGTFECMIQEANNSGYNTHATLSGTNITVSSWSGTSTVLVYPGSSSTTAASGAGVFFRPFGALAVTQILSQTSGAPNGAGVYTASVNQSGSTTAGMFTPYYGTWNVPTVGPNVNVNLQDGSTMTYVGYDLQQTGAVCNGNKGTPVP